MEEAQTQDQQNPTRHELLRADRFRVERLQWQSADGRSQTKDVIRHPGAVVILPLLEDGRICLIRNQRVSVGEALLEVPAGTLEPDEDPLDCAVRELQEETGFRAGKMEEVCWFYPSPGILDEKMHLFLATELQEGPANPMPDEDIQNVILTSEEALQLVRNGRIQDGKTMIALLQLPTLFGSRGEHV